MKIVDCEQCNGDGCPNCDGYGYYAVHETRLTTGGKTAKTADKPRFTEDEIAQMNREAIQIYHDENLRLAEKVAAWEALGKELVAWLQPEFGDDYGRFGILDILVDSFKGYDAIKRLLELTSD